MRSKFIIALSILLVLVSGGYAFSQTVTVAPTQVPAGAYVNGGGVDADDNYYWQTATIDFPAVADGAGSTILITLPADMDVADVDMDGDPDNEISLAWTGTGAVAGDFTINAAGTTESAITINMVNDQNAAQDWILYVQFPVKTTTLATGTDNYTFTFSEANFLLDPTFDINYRASGALQIVNFLAALAADDDSTTANNYQGISYPNPAAAFYGALPDFVKDPSAVTIVANGVWGAVDDGVDTNDITYTLWVATDSTLSHVSQYEQGVLVAQNYTTPGDFTQNEGAALANAIYTGGLPEGEYYFYVTSDFTGDFPLFRSGKLTVTHFPYVSLAGWDRLGDGFDNSGGDADDAALTLDTGDFYQADGTKATAIGSGVTNVDMYVSVDDLDDNAQVYLYYSAANDLDAADVVTSGEAPFTITGLTGATSLVDTLYENLEDVEGFISWNWDVVPGSDGTYIASGDYTIYAVASDGKHYNIRKFDGTDPADAPNETINIRHSPALTIDVLTEYNTGVDEDANADVTIDPADTDVIMISWGKSGIGGDVDLDDSATIEFYIDYDTDQNGTADYGNEVANEADNIRAAAGDTPTGTHLIFSGMLEDLEGKDQSWFAWDLKADHDATGWYPLNESDAAGPHFYHLYAIIDENKTGGTKRVVALGGDGIVNVTNDLTDIEFDNDLGFARAYGPPAEGVTVNADQTYRINLNAFDFDDDADVGIFLVKKTVAIDGVTGPAQTVMGIASGRGIFSLANGAAYCITDDDGDHVTGGQAWIAENSLATTPYYDMTLSIPGAGLGLVYDHDTNASATALTDGEYYVYVGIDDGSYKTEVLTLGANEAYEFHVGDLVAADTNQFGVVVAVAGAADQITVDYHGPDFGAGSLIDIGTSYVATEATVGAAAGPAAAADFSAASVPLYRAPGTIKVTGAGNVPAMKNLTVSPMAVDVAEGDTLNFLIKGADIASTIDFVDLYIAVEKDYWALVDSISPLTPETTYSGLVIANTLIDDVANNRWIIRGTLNNLGTTINLADTGTGTTLFTLPLVSTGTISAIKETTSIYFVNEPASGRVTRFRNDGNEIAVNTMASNVNIVPRPMIEGIVEFEGRNDMSAQITFELRERGSYVPVSDSIFIYQNDEDLAVSGIQYTLDSDGKFTLMKAPSGEWDMVAIYPRYLSAKRVLELNAGVDTVFVSFGQLLGGDAYGYTDSLNAAYPDNEIDTAGDVNRINTAFMATAADPEWNDGTNNWMYADINEDGIVEEDDLSMATGNVTQRGAEPVYKPGVMPVSTNLDAVVEFMNAPTEFKAGETYTIQLIARNTAGVRAYFVNMNYDKEVFTYNSIRKGDFIQASSYSFPVIEGETVGLVNSVYGSTITSGDGILAEVTFTALKDGSLSSNMLSIEQASFVNENYIQEILIDSPTGVEVDAAPAAFVVGQNFPNPFNPTTTITFAIPNDGNVRVEVYDILGQRVATLVDNSLSAGNHSVVWNATNERGNEVAAGVYFYTIKAGSHAATKRMILMK